MSGKFYNDMTYEEWASKQDKNNLEYKIVQEIHNVYSNWSLDEIKTYAPIFMSTHMKIVRDINKDDVTLNIQDIEKRAINYMAAGIRGNMVHMEVFGDKEPCDDYHYLAKWNNGLCKIMDILLSSSKYKLEDDKGHAAGQSIKLAEHQYSFRAEKQLDRDIHKIIDHHDQRFETKSDFLRELIFKGTEIYTLINSRGLGPVAEEIFSRVKDYRIHYEEADLDQQLKTIEDQFSIRRGKLDRLIKNRSSRDALEEFRNEIVDYLKEKLSLPLKKQDKEEIRVVIQDSRDLEKILDTLEREKLVSKEYVDNMLKDAKIVPFIGPITSIDVVSNNDVRPNDRR